MLQFTRVHFVLIPCFPRFLVKMVKEMENKRTLINEKIEERIFEWIWDGCVLVPKNVIFENGRIFPSQR